MYVVDHDACCRQAFGQIGPIHTAIRLLVTNLLDTKYRIAQSASSMASLGGTCIKAAQVSPNCACREPESRGPARKQAPLRAEVAPSADADQERLPTEDEFLRLNDMERFVQDAEEAALNADDAAESQEDGDEDEEEEEQGSNSICIAGLPSCQAWEQLYLIPGQGQDFLMPRCWDHMQLR